MAGLQNLFNVAAHGEETPAGAIALPVRSVPTPRPRHANPPCQPPDSRLAAPQRRIACCCGHPCCRCSPPRSHTPPVICACCTAAPLRCCTAALLCAGLRTFRQGGVESLTEHPAPGSTPARLRQR
jgi:hypothetical protein